MPRTMKAAVVTAFGSPLEVTEVPIQEPRRDGIQVKLAACGVSIPTCARQTVIGL